MADAWLYWWLVLCSATAFNVAAWGVSARLLARERARLSPDIYRARTWLLCLAAVYVLGCGFRSILPMVDVPRICLYDIDISRVAVGRTIATVAELCFAAQWTLLLHEAGTATGNRLTMRLVRTLMPAIVAAEISCWIAVLSTSFLPHVIENSLWTLTAALALAGFAATYPELDSRSRRFLHAAALCGLGYITFMVTVDVPMYVARWQHDLATARPILTLVEGAREVVAPCIVNRNWTAWREDAVWLSVYFTVAVWISIALPHAPPLRRTAPPRDGKAVKPL